MFFLDFGDARGLGLLFVDCACAVGLRGNRLIGTRGTWGVVWRSAHVPTIPFTWLRRVNAWALTAHASNYQAQFSIKLCQECGFNSCVRVFFIPWGHVSNHAQIWAFVTSISHMVQILNSDWSRKFLLRSDWSVLKGAIYTTDVGDIVQRISRPGKKKNQGKEGGKLPAPATKNNGKCN